MFIHTRHIITAFLIQPIAITYWSYLTFYLFIYLTFTSQGTSKASNRLSVRKFGGIHQLALLKEEKLTSRLKSSVL